MYANLLGALGRFDEALAEERRALELNPVSPNAKQNRVFLLFIARRYDEALAALEKVAPADTSRGSTVAAAIGFTLAQAGRRDQACAVLERLQHAAGLDYVSAYDLALPCAATGRTDEAFTRLQQAYDGHASFLPFVAVNARWDPIRRDPRFEAFLERMRFPRDAGG